MITEPILLDAGPLVAILHQQDAYHGPCRDQAALIAGPVLTSWPVITEAAWLLRKLPGSLQRLLQLVADRDIRCLHLEPRAVAWLAAVSAQYQDLAPQLADLSLLYLAEQHEVHHIFTLDRRDFSVYRKRDGKSFHLLPETL